MKSCFVSYWRSCRPYPLPEPWDSCKVDRNVRQGPTSTEGILPTLLKKHGVESLLAAGLAVLDEGRPQLHPFLDGPNIGVLALRDRHGEIYDLLTERGCVVGRRSPILEAFDDEVTRRLASCGAKQLFLVEKFIDIVLLRSLGYAAAPLAGLEQIDRAGLRQLARRFGITANPSDREIQRSLESGEPPASESTTPNEIVRLTIVNWRPHSVARTESPAALSGIEFLNRLARFRGLNLSEVDLWRPLETDLDELRFALERRERAWIAEAVANSLFRCCGSMVEFREAPIEAAAPKSLAEAVDLIERLTAEGGTDAGRRRLEEALGHYASATRRFVLGPLLRQGEASTDPMDRLMNFQLAHFTTLFSYLAPRVKAEFVQLSKLDGEQLKRFDEAMDDLLAISGTLVTLTREMRRWKPKRVASLNSSARAIAASEALAKKTTRRFDVSALAMKN